MQSFEDFLSVQMDPLIRYSQLLTGDRNAAHDLLADTLVGVHQRWNRISNVEYPLAYVRSMVLNRHINAQKRFFRRGNALTRTGSVPEQAWPADRANQLSDRMELEGLLELLPPRQRAAVVLRYFFDLPYEAISAELGITTASARSSIARALITLRRTATTTTGPGSDNV